MLKPWKISKEYPATAHAHNVTAEEAVRVRDALKVHGPEIDQRTIIAAMDALVDRNRVLESLINSPEVEDFLKGTQLEAAHQVERWGAPHDRKKSAENWFWLVGYLAGKALRAAITGDRDKALHHCISTSAALLNWHRAIQRDTTGCGLGEDNDIRQGEV